MAEVTPDEFGNVIDNSAFIGNLPKNPINLPSARNIQVNMKHILSNHTQNGQGYVQSIRSGTKNVKTLFPKTWNQKTIEMNIREAYRGVQKMETQGDRVRVRGYTKGGIVIEMWVNTVTKVIETAYPIF